MITASLCSSETITTIFYSSQGSVHSETYLTGELTNSCTPKVATIPIKTWTVKQIGREPLTTSLHFRLASTELAHQHTGYLMHSLFMHVH